MKACTKCRQLKPLTAFYKTGNGNSDRLHSWCAWCCTQAQIERRNTYRRKNAGVGTGMSPAARGKALAW